MKGQVCTSCQIIACENHEVGRKSIGHGDAFRKILGAHQPAAVKIGKMGDGQTMKCGRKSLDTNGNASDMREARFDQRGIEGSAGTDDGR